MDGFKKIIARDSVLLLILSIIAVGCARTGPNLEAFGASAPRHSATVVAHRLNSDWWKDRHAGVLEQIKEGRPDLILVGDSITHGWDRNMEIWNAHFGEYTMVNMGFSGDRTQHVLWRFENGELDGISPRLAVIMIGTNNSNGEDNTAREIGDGIGAICAELRALLPDVELLVLAIFPRGKKPSTQREKNEGASLFAKDLARSDKHVHYLDIGDVFLTGDGTLPKEIMPDFLHPNAAGYELWAGAMEGEVRRLMKR